MNDDKTSVLIVDGDSSYRQSLTQLIRNEGYDVLGVVGTGAEAVQLAASSPPDLVLMDFMLPGMDGSCATSQLLHVAPRSRVIALGCFEIDQAMRMLQAGAQALVRKTNYVNILAVMCAMCRFATAHRHMGG